MSEKIYQCVFESKVSPLAIDFHLRDGRVHGFPYGHLLHFLHETNPDIDLQPNAPAERFMFCFSTHDVVLSGWRLKGLVPLLCDGKLTSIHAMEARYRELEEDSPFVADISVQAAQQDSP